MHFIRKGSLLAVGVLAVAAAFMLVMANFSASDRAEAATGTLDGAYDIEVPLGAGSAYHCIGKIAHSGAALTTTFNCNADVQLGDPNGEPPDRPGEGMDGLAGPPPPPPYATLPAATGSGAVTGTSATTVTCFPNLGGGSTPNILARVVDADATVDIADGVTLGLVEIWANVSDAKCTTSAATGTVTGLPVVAGLPVNLYRVADKAGTTGTSGVTGGCDNSPFVNTLGNPRSAHCVDFDEDGCNDTVEITNTAGAAACGDDPYNPFDSSIASLNGIYSTLATVGAGANCPAAAPDHCPWSGTVATNPLNGIYYHCISAIRGNPHPSYEVKIYCYIDSAALDVNPEGYPGCKGDGLPGASPPGKIDPDASGPLGFSCGGVAVWGDVSQIKQAKLTGTLTGSTFTTTGCFEDDDASSPLGHVYVSATQNARTGNGTVSIHAGMPTLADCQNGTNLTAAILATLNVGRQTNGLSTTSGTVPNNDADYRDTDGDGCSDVEELGDSGAFGGLRDPYNRGDWFDPDHNGVIDLFEDIFGVAGKFGLTTSDAGYDADYDRGAGVLGSNVWNITPANGVIDLFDDIFGVAFMFGHDCSA